MLKPINLSNIYITGSNPYGSEATPLAQVPPEVPPHGKPSAAGAQRRGTGPPRDSYCEQVAIVNMNLNQCSSMGALVSTKKVASEFLHPCEREPLLATQAATSSLAAHVLPKSAVSQHQKHSHRPSQHNSNNVSNNSPSEIGHNNQQRHHMKQQQQQLQSSRSASHQHKHQRHDHSQQQEQKQSPQSHHHHHHHHNLQASVSVQHHSHQSQKKWPVSSHFPDWDQREGGRAGISWKSRSAQARLRHPSDPSQPVQHKHNCKAAAATAIEINNPVGLILPSLPKHYQVEEAGVRNKLRNLTRHYSDDSLHGSSNRELYSTRIHSSADEISSVNRSPSISSSDESFSRTDFSRTDADSPSPERAPSLNDVRFKYMFGDMNTDVANVPRFRELSPQLYSDYLSSVKASSDESSLRLNSLTLDSSNHSHNNVSGSMRESGIGPPLTDSDRHRRDDLFIPRLTAEFSSDKVKRTKTDPSSFMKHDVSSLRSSSSPMSDKVKSNLRSSFNENDAMSPYRGNVSGSTGRLLSLERSPSGAGTRTPDSHSSGVSKRRSLPRDSSARRPVLGEHLGGRKTSSMREYDRKENSNKVSSKNSIDSKVSPDCINKHNFDSQVDSKRPIHHRKASGDFERMLRLGLTFEGISEDPVVMKATTSDRYGPSFQLAYDDNCRSNSSNNYPESSVLNRYGLQRSPVTHTQECYHNSRLSPDCGVVAQSLERGNTLEGYSALHKLAKLQEDALLSSLEETTIDDSSPSLIQRDPVKLGLYYDAKSKRSVLQLSPVSGVLSYETGKEGSLLR